MRIIHYSKTPLAAAPYHIVKCLQKYTDLEVDLFNETYKYQDGRVFPYMRLLDGSQQAETDSYRFIKTDIIHTHNQLSQTLKYLMSNLKAYYPSDKTRLFSTMHSSPKMYNWQETISSSEKSFVIRQPMQLKEYQGVLTESLPSPLDIFDLNPIDRPTNKIIINFAPSTSHPISMPSSKGCNEVHAILMKLKERYKDKIEIDFYRNIPHLEDLKRKQKAHIVIDDCVHETFHLTGLFGLSFGCVVFNGIKDKNFVDFYNKNYEKQTEKSPFVSSDLTSLYIKLSEIIESPIINRMEESRKWMEEFYNPKDLVQTYIKAYNM